jgi:soluble lytic murein transglycosylase
VDLLCARPGCRRTPRGRACPRSLHAAAAASSCCAPSRRQACDGELVDHPAAPPPPPQSVTRAPTGPWAQQAEWVSGLASWRLNDCNTAARAFREVGERSTEPSLAAAGYYWAARAEMACRRPAAVQPCCAPPPAMGETFYGLLARRTLGQETRLAPLDPNAAAASRACPTSPAPRSWSGSASATLPASCSATRPGSARRPSRPPWSPSRPAGACRHPALPRPLRPARRPRSGRRPLSRSALGPREGWRIDPALALAHALQESSFRSEAVSQAGAVGLMQVLPSTRDLIVRSRGLAPATSGSRR